MSSPYYQCKIIVLLSKIRYLTLHHIRISISFAEKLISRDNLIKQFELGVVYLSTQENEKALTYRLLLLVNQWSKEDEKRK